MTDFPGFIRTPDVETTGYAQEVEDPWAELPPRSSEDWDEVWARVTYENVMRRYPRIMKALGEN